jgi:hypothetical protein
MKNWRLVWRNGQLESAAVEPPPVREEACSNTEDGAHVCRITIDDEESIVEALADSIAEHPEWKIPAASKREKVEALIEALTDQAMGDFDEHPQMGEPCAVALSIMWLSGVEDGMIVGTELPGVTTTAHTAIHKTCALEPEYVLDILGQALEGSQPDTRDESKPDLGNLS